MKQEYIIRKTPVVSALAGLIILIEAILVFSPCFVARASDTPDQNVINDLNSQIDAQKNKIDALTSKITEYNANIKNNQKEAVSLKNQMMILNNQLAETNLEVSLKEEQAKQIQLQIEQTGLRINQTEDQIVKNKIQLADLLRLISRYEERNYIDILLANDSFSDFFDQLKYSTDLQRELQQTVDRIKETEAKLMIQKADLEKQKKGLSDTLIKLDDTKAALSSQKDDKNQLIIATNKSEKKFEALIKLLKQEQATANSQAAALEKKLRAELAKKGKSEKFNSLSNASLIWPTDSHRLTTYFHDPTYPYINVVGQHSGLDIGVKSGTAIHSADAGYVAKTAYNTKWYGNYIMVIHGGNITTLYAHLSSINVAQDQYVTRGQLIGLSGSTGFSSGPHLHFEVRSNGIPVDPMGYLP